MDKNINEKPNPLLYFENILWYKGIDYIAGVDEAGLGALAGPVIAGAVVFPKGVKFFALKDSKKLTPKKREALYKTIRKEALFIGIGRVNSKEINRFNNIYKSGLEALRRAVLSLKVEPQHILVDGRKIPEIDVPQNRFNKGEDISFSIAAASIIAKVYRDNLMRRYAKVYPEYEFDRHKGYATSLHTELLKKKGPCKIHRVSYEFVKGICGGFSKKYFKFSEEINGTKDKNRLTFLLKNLNSPKGKLSRTELSRLRRKITFKKNRLSIL